MTGVLHDQCKFDTYKQAEISTTKIYLCWYKALVEESTLKDEEMQKQLIVISSQTIKMFELNEIIVEDYFYWRILEVQYVVMTEK